MSGLSLMLRLGLLGVAAMTVAAPGILLSHVTTGHDWYAARKLTVEEVMLAAGFRKYKPVAYRTVYGDTWNIPRAVFVEHGPPIRARRRILATIMDGVLLGAGMSGTVFCLMLLGAAGHLRRGRAVATVKPAPPAESYRHPASRGATGRGADRSKPESGRGRAALPAAPVKKNKNTAVVSGSLAASRPGAGAAGPSRTPPVANPHTGTVPDKAGPGTARPKTPAKPGSGQAGKSRREVTGAPRKRTAEKDSAESSVRRNPSRLKPEDDEGWF